MIAALWLLSVLIGAEQNCNPGSPPFVNLIRPAPSQRFLTGTSVDIEVDLRIRGAYDVVLEFVPAFEPGRFNQEGKLDLYGPYYSSFVGRYQMKTVSKPDDTRVSATIVLGNDHVPVFRDPQGRYVLVVTFSTGEGDCKETYSDVAGVVTVGPLAKHVSPP